MISRLSNVSFVKQIKTIGSSRKVQLKEGIKTSVNKIKTPMGPQYVFSTLSDNKPRYQQKVEQTIKQQVFYQDVSLKQTPKYSVQTLKLVRMLSQARSYFIYPLYHLKTYHYAAYLISFVNKVKNLKITKDDKLGETYFRQIKNCMKNSQQQLIFTPKSVLRLIQQFSQVDFEGDQSNILNKMLDYVQDNCLRLTQFQLQRFKTAYQRIMVQKAMGPVKFRPYKVQKRYTSELERKGLLIKQLLAKTFCIQQTVINKQILLDSKSHRKWSIITLPYKNIHIVTYPQQYQSLSEQQAYQFIYDIRQIIHRSIAKLKKLKKLKTEIKVDVSIREFSDKQDNDQFQLQTVKGIVYKSIKNNQDQMQRLRQMRKFSLKEQIQRMKQKKKQAKTKHKNKAKVNHQEQDINMQQAQQKRIDLFETIKYQIAQMNEEQVLKMFKKSSQKRKLKRKQRVINDKNVGMQNSQKQQEQQEQQEQDQFQTDQDQVQNVEQQFLSRLDLSQPKQANYAAFVQKVKEELMRAQAKKVNLHKKTPSMQEQQHVSTPLVIQPPINLSHTRTTIRDRLKDIVNSNSLKELRQFLGYIQLVESLQSGLRELNRKQREIQSALQNEEQKGLIGRFSKIRNQLNQESDTGIRLGCRISQIFNIPQQRLLKQPFTIRKKAEDNKLSPKLNTTWPQSQDKKSESSIQKIYILSQQQLINTLERQDNIRKFKTQKENHRQNHRQTANLNTATQNKPLNQKMQILQKVLNSKKLDL